MMRLFWEHHGKRLALGVTVTLTAFASPCVADKPTGAPLELSSIETEQAIPLATLAPDGKTAQCILIKLHWNPNTNVGPYDDSTRFDLDVSPETPGASIFVAQLWNASLASALAWQQPWQGARWKVLQTPTTDGSGIDAALAVGMIATSARRLYPKDTVVIGSLNPDGSLGAVSRLAERIDAAAAAGMTRVIIPGVQRFDTDASGQVLNIVRHADDLHMECDPVDNLVEATETAMNDPLPETTLDSSTPKYSSDVASYIDGFARREQDEAAEGLRFAPKEADLANYPLRLAASWRAIYADYAAAEQAYRGGQVYVAYRLFFHANARMHGVNALAEQNRGPFDVKAVLAESDGLRQKLHALMNPPAIDKGELESALLVAEMADWAYDLNASLEGAQLVTKQAFSQRSDATQAEKDRAEQMILSAIKEDLYLLDGADFYRGLLEHIGNNSPMPVDENATHLLPQLIPAQLATAQLFTDGIRPRANEMRDGLLFDPRLAAYVNVLRETKADWDARQRKKELDDQAEPTPAPAAAGTTNGTPDDSSQKPNAAASPGNVAFDPGNTYAPPHTVLTPTAPVKKMSDVAACLIWVNNDCEIATLDEKYLRVSGSVDPVTHEWHVKDRAKLDAMLQAAEIGARNGITFAGKAEVDPSVLAMIYEKASHARIQGSDADALDALRNYWRCALLGNICWQLAHNRKAEAVDLGGVTPDAGKGKPDKDGGKKPDDKTKAPEVATTKDKSPARPEDTNSKKPDETARPHEAADKTPVPAPPPANVVVAPTPPPGNPIANPAPPAVTNAMVAADPPVAPLAPHETAEPHEPLKALPVTDDSATNAAPPPSPPPAPAPPLRATPIVLPADTNIEMNVPMAPLARPEDLNAAATNAAPVVGPAPPAGATQ